MLQGFQDYKRREIYRDGKDYVLRQLLGSNAFNFGASYQPILRFDDTYSYITRESGYPRALTYVQNQEAEQTILRHTLLENAGSMFTSTFSDAPTPSKMLPISIMPCGFLEHFEPTYTQSLQSFPSLRDLSALLQAEANNSNDSAWYKIVKKDNDSRIFVLSINEAGNANGKGSIQKHKTKTHVEKNPQFK